MKHGLLKKEKKECHHFPRRNAGASLKLPILFGVAAIAQNFPRRNAGASLKRGDGVLLLDSFIQLSPA